MITEKHRIIRRMGVTVDIISPDGDVMQSKILLGRASQVFSSNMENIESHRRGQFLPETNIDNGYIVHNPITGEDYLVVSIYSDIINNTLSTKVSHMLVCNVSIDVMGDDIEEADDRGNIRRTPQVKYTDLKAYLEVVNMDVKQYDIGLHPDTEYLVYVSAKDISLLDRVIVTIGERKLPTKVVGTDYAKYPGILILQLSSETRE